MSDEPNQAEVTAAPVQAETVAFVSSAPEPAADPVVTPAPAKKPAAKKAAGKKSKPVRVADAAPAADGAADEAASRPARTKRRKPAADAVAEAAPAQEAPAVETAPVVPDAASEQDGAPAPLAEAPRAGHRRSHRMRADAPAPEAAVSVDEAPAQVGSAPAVEASAEPAAPKAPAQRPVRLSDDATVEEMLAQIPRRRRGRPNKQELAARKALDAAQKNATPELVAAARAAVQAYMGTASASVARKAEGERAAAPEAPAAAAPVAASAAAAEEASAAESDRGPRRRHHDRRSIEAVAPTPGEHQHFKGPDGVSHQGGKRDRRDDRAQNGGQGGSYGQQRDRRDDRKGGGGQGNGGNNGQGKQFGGNGKNKNDRRNNDRRQREVVAAPKTNREELEELKVGDLRTQASELGIDPAGLKKPELVDAVYDELVRREGFFDFTGILDLTNEGFGFIRTKGYLASENDVYIGANVVRSYGLRRGDEVAGIGHASRPNDKYPAVARISLVNGVTPEALRSRPRFGDLTPVFPTEPLRMEHGKDSILGRCIDLVAPIGKGQRGLIVSPPKAGKTTVLKKIAESIAANNPEVHLICLLVDERPEEVTDMQRSIKGEVVASTFDMPCDNHIMVSELVIERAKRLVEQGRDVVILLDSITRLARAYNLAQPASGRILSGGVDSTALYPPKRFLGAARNIEGGGSLTILASALVDTGSKMDEVIFEEFKGTGNMELKLDRDLADRRVFPAIDPISSGTRKEELLLSSEIAPLVWGVRRILANMNNNERAMTQLIRSLKATGTNEEFLIRSAKKAQMQEGFSTEL